MSRSTRPSRLRRSTLAVRRLEDRTVPSSVQGTVFNDTNHNQIFDPGESGLPGWTAYVDNNQNSIIDLGEVTTVTDANGNYFIDTSTIPTNSGRHYVGLDLQVGSGGRWVNDTSTVVSANPASEPAAVRNFGVHFQPYASVQPDGPEALINLTTANEQFFPDVAADAAGNYVIAWSSSASGNPIMARVFNADGTPRSGELSVAASSDTLLHVAMADNGRFVVAWSVLNPSTSTLSVMARAYNADASPATATITVSAATANTSKWIGDVAMDAVGNFAVLYESWGHNGDSHIVQRYSAAGAALGGTITVANTVTWGGARQSIAMDSAGKFVVAWDQAINGTTVFAQRYSAAGQKTGSQLTVATGTNSNPFFQCNAAINNADRFVVTWSEYSNGAIHAQVYDWGTPVGGNLDVGFSQSSTGVDIDDANNVTFAWVKDNEIRFRRLLATGTLESESFANTTMQGFQGNGVAYQTIPTGIAATDNNHFVVAWQGYGPGDDQGIFAQRFTDTPPPPPPTTFFSIDDVSVTEGNAGTTLANFTVTLSAASSDTVTVQFLTANGTATSGSDFQSTGGTLTFAPGETSQVISVPIIGDRLGETDESFVVNLSAPVNAGITDGQGVGTIVDDEPRLTINDVSHNEGAQNTTTAFTFTVNLSAVYDQAVTMSYHTTDGTATTGNNDYVAQTGTLTFNPGETTKQITITVNGDKKRESDETFNVELYNPSSNVFVADNLGLGTIVNDD